MYLAIGIQPGVSGRMYLARYIRPDISGWIYPARYIQPDISGQIYPAGYIWLDITSGVHQGSPGVTSCGFCEQVFLITFYILRVESDDQDEAVQDEPEFETDVVVGDKLVEILGRLEKLIGSKHPWNSKTVQVSELMVMKTKAQEALAFLHGRTRP